MNQVPIEQVRLFLLQIFEKWGLPKALRSDNGLPFGLPNRDAIPMMSLWLKGWGINPILNRPRHPQDNAQVERAQGTSSRWAEVNKAIDLTDLQKRLDIIREEQRDKYPVKRLKYAHRTQVFPDLYQILRPFDATKFDIKAVYAFLGSKTLQRKVSTTGAISLYGKTTFMDRKIKGSILFIKFDDKKMQWVVRNNNNDILKQISDERFSEQNIILITLCQ